MKSPIENKNILLNKKTPLTSKEKDMFAYFGVDAKIKPPYRILNPHRIFIGDKTSIQEYSHINAFEHLTFLRKYQDSKYINDSKRGIIFTTPSNPEVPIMQQPNKVGEPILIMYGSWIGTGAVILPGTQIGKFSVVGANSVCQGIFPNYSVVAPEHAKLLYTRFNE